METGKTEEKKRLDWRIQVKVSEEFYRRFDGYCKQFGLTKSQLGNICLHAGFNSIVRAISPEEVITKDLLVKLLGLDEIRDEVVNTIERRRHGKGAVEAEG